MTKPSPPRRRLLALPLLLAGCQTPAPPPPAPPPPPPPPPPKTIRGLTPAQVAVLDEERFQETAEGWELGFGNKILFGFDSDVLDAKAREIVARLGRTLHEAGIRQLRVVGHTDNRGAAEYNRRLSRRRADVVAQALASGGFPAADVEVQGLGPDQPIADNGTAHGRGENRRVAVVVPAPAP